MRDILDHLPDGIARQRVLNTAEAAEFLNFSVPHFRRLYRNGGVPHRSSSARASSAGKPAA